MLHRTCLVFVLGFLAAVASAAESLPPFPLSESTGNSLYHRALAKKVYDSRLIDNMEQPAKWSSNGIGKMSYTEERARDGRRSLRFRTPMRDEGHLKRNRNDQGSFVGDQGGWTSIILCFDGPQDWSAFNRLSMWIYVHPNSIKTHSLTLALDCQGLPDNATSPFPWHVVHDLRPGEWNHVVWEIPNLPRDKVASMSVGLLLRGHDPEDRGIVTYDIDQIELQRVDAEPFEGWAVAPGRIAFNHVGYRPGDRKVALAGDGAGERFEVVSADRKTVAIEKPIESITTPRGTFRVLDFSELQSPGEYVLRTGNLKSQALRIAEDVWRRPAYKALNFFFCERCGYDVPGIHRVCHQDWQGSYKDVKKIINGGWHDAGDLSQGTWRTAMAVYAMLELIQRRELKGRDQALYDRTLDEALWGLDWLLKTQFADGHRMTWSTMRLYTDNKLGTNDDVITPAQNVPWENFLSAAVEALAVDVLRKERPKLAERCLVAARADWKAAIQSRSDWSSSSCLEAAWGALAAVQLCRATGEAAFGDRAVELGRLVIQCQEQGLTDAVPLTGFFYTHTSRGAASHDYHAAFEESPLLALNALCETFPDHDQWIQWYSAALIHSEFFLKRGSRITAPYELMPNSIWRKDEITQIGDQKQREAMLRQWEDGTHLGDNRVLRIFPIWRDRTFHGNTNAHLSATLALAAASRLRGDRDGEQLVARQLQWVFGGNPFCQSLMYGEGYDYPPLFAYCLKNVVGALPVGMDSMRNDEPYWPDSNYACFKEIWTAPTERFLWLMAYEPLPPANTADGNAAAIKLAVRVTASDEVNSSAAGELTIEGSGSHSIQYRVFNATLADPVDRIDLVENRPAKVLVKLKVEDRMKPWVVVVTVDGSQSTRQELFGAFVRSFP
ncbi:MAG: glycoside hydrolase family 9 protein [Pirellulales bacterium]|nr:glycoside hydrolase family 9 protein [Pirellulales bacterium]